MGIKTTYLCDCCEKAVPKREDLWKVTVRVTQLDPVPNPNRSGITMLESYLVVRRPVEDALSTLLCKVCLEDGGYNLPAPVEPDPVVEAKTPPAPTIEERFRELVAMCQDEDD